MDYEETPHRMLERALEPVAGELSAAGVSGPVEDDSCDCCAGRNIAMGSAQVRTYATGRHRGHLGNGWDVEVDIETADGSIRDKRMARVRSLEEMTAFFAAEVATSVRTLTADSNTCASRPDLHAALERLDLLGQAAAHIERT